MSSDQKRKREVGSRIKQLIGATSINGARPSVESFAAAIGADPKQLYRWMKGETSPGTEYLTAMHEHKDIRANTNWVLCGTGDIRVTVDGRVTGTSMQATFEAAREELLTYFVHIERLGTRRELEPFAPCGGDMLEVSVRLWRQRFQWAQLLQEAGRRPGRNFIPSDATSTHVPILGEWHSLLRRAS